MYYTREVDWDTIQEKINERKENKMTVTKKQLEEQDRQQAIETLKNIMEDANYKVYTALQHVSSSGMLRVISCYVALVNKDGKPYIRDITWYVAKVLDMKRDEKRGGIRVSGAGMDMGFYLVYNLSMKLYCPDKYDHDAAYKLKHQWL